MTRENVPIAFPSTESSSHTAIDTRLGTSLARQLADGRTREGAQAARRHRVHQRRSRRSGAFVGGPAPIDRCAAKLSVELEKMDAASMIGEPFSIDLYGQICDRLSRLFHRLGLRRVAKTVTNVSPLDDHFSRPAPRKVEAAE